MGTTGVLALKIDGKIKMTHYTRYDGYPSGLGLNAFNFIKNNDLKKFKKQVKNLKNYTKKDFENSTDDFFETGIFDSTMNAEILNLIYSGEIKKVDNDKDYLGNDAKDYLYVIDLDIDEFAIYKGEYKKRDLFKSVKFTELNENLFNKWDDEVYGNTEEDSFTENDYEPDNRIIHSDVFLVPNLDMFYRQDIEDVILNSEEEKEYLKFCKEFDDFNENYKKIIKSKFKKENE